jgi:2-C-methyl-D-erythritol 4-phosphate cytidylyltransferase
MKSAVLLLAAGSGQRMRGSVSDKALTRLGGQTAIGYCVRAFLAAGFSGPMLVVYRDESQRAALEAAINPIHPASGIITWVKGGRERQESVGNALRALPGDCDYIYIHDAARPCIHPDAIAELALAVQRDGAAALAHPITDTIKRIPQADQLRSIELEDLDRSRLWAMETPQAFAAEKIQSAYKHICTSGESVTDDTAAASSIGLKTTLVPNPYPNPKLTTPDDLRSIEYLLRQTNLGRLSSAPPKEA